MTGPIEKPPLAVLVERFASELQQRSRAPGDTISLDEVAVVLGDHAGNTELVSRVLDVLEAQGCDVDAGPGLELGGLLKQILVLARQERSAGRSVGISALAEALELEPRLVRVALLYAEVLMRGRGAN